LKTNYIKRCVAVAGDSLEIKDRQVYTNGDLLENHSEVQFSYMVTSDGPINERNFAKFELGPEDYQVYGRQQDGRFVYLMWLTQERADALKALPYIKSVDIQNRTDEDGLIPYSSYYELPGSVSDSEKVVDWSTDNFGPLWIPQEGVTIPINESTLTLYGPTIRLYEHHDDVKIDNNTLTIDGKAVTEYTFRQNYYFMMGDNRHNSLDSRFWGFVPEDHVVGKAFFIWLSIDKNSSFIHKIRWSRFFKLIR
jgi:signal peptidase I